MDLEKHLDAMVYEIRREPEAYITPQEEMLISGMRRRTSNVTNPPTTPPQSPSDMAGWITPSKYLLECEQRQSNRHQTPPSSSWPMEQDEDGIKEITVIDISSDTVIEISSDSDVDSLIMQVDSPLPHDLAHIQPFRGDEEMDDSPNQTIELFDVENSEVDETNKKYPSGLFVTPGKEAQPSLMDFYDNFEDMTPPTPDSAAAAATNDQVAKSASLPFPGSTATPPPLSTTQAGNSKSAPNRKLDYSVEIIQPTASTSTSPAPPPPSIYEALAAAVSDYMISQYDTSDDDDDDKKKDKVVGDSHPPISKVKSSTPTNTSTTDDQINLVADGTISPIICEEVEIDSVPETPSPPPSPTSSSSSSSSSYSSTRAYERNRQIIRALFIAYIDSEGTCPDTITLLRWHIYQLDEPLRVSLFYYLTQLDVIEWHIDYLDCALDIMYRENPDRWGVVYRFFHQSYIGVPFGLGPLRVYTDHHSDSEDSDLESVTSSCYSTDSEDDDDDDDDDYYQPPTKKFKAK